MLARMSLERQTDLNLPSDFGRRPKLGVADLRRGRHRSLISGTSLWNWASSRLPWWRRHLESRDGERKVGEV